MSMVILMVIIKPISIQDLYERLRDELVELMNLFYRDRELFIQEVINRADNEISLLNILAFDPSSPDSQIVEIDENRLLFYITKDRYYKKWSEHARLQYLVIGVNDNFSVFAYHIRNEPHRFVREVLGRAMDIYMFDNDDNGRIILPYNVPVRIQGDVIVIRHREFKIDMTEEVLLQLDGELTNQDIDRLLDSVSDRVRFTAKQRAAIKLKYKALKRIGKKADVRIRTVRVVESVFAPFDDKSVDYYRLALSWIGGASHLIEYYGLRPVEAPWRDRVYVKVIGEEVKIMHGSHVPVVLKVKPGDIIEFRLIQQSHDMIPNHALIVQTNPNQPTVQDFDRSFAWLIYQRFTDRFDIDRKFYYLYINAKRKGLDGIVNDMIRFAKKTILGYAFKRFNMDKVYSYVKEFITVDYENALNDIKQMVGEKELFTPIGEFATYVHFYVGKYFSVRPVQDAMNWFRNYFEARPDWYETAVVDNDLVKLREIAEIGPVAKKVLYKAIDLGFTWRAYLARWRSNKPEKYDVRMICVNDYVCVEF